MLTEHKYIEVRVSIRNAHGPDTSYRFTDASIIYLGSFVQVSGILSLLNQEPTQSKKVFGCGNITMTLIDQH